MRDFVAALRGLTVRGRSFIAAGAACAASAVVLGEQDLLRIGLLIALLPVLAAAFVCRTRYRLACTRRLEPRRVTVGDRVAVRIKLENVSRLSSSVLLVEDSVSDGLGSGARFVLDRIEPGGTRDLSYPLLAHHRGRFQVGPMAIRLSDPFGLCELSRSFRSQDELVVAPAIETLPPARPGSAASVSAELRRTTGLVGVDETTTRPYRSGDDLRKVHWRTTARSGELMVRRDERPQTGSATVLLDTRLGGWTETEPSAPFEWAVSAAGTIAIHLARGGLRVRFLTDQGVAATVAGATVGSLLDELSTMVPAPAESLTPALAAVRGSGGTGGMLVAVLGRTDAATATMIAGLRSRGAPAIAVLVDLDSWETDPGAAADLGVANTVFTRAGWATLVGGRDTVLAKIWPQATTARSGSARPRSRPNGSGRSPAATVAGAAAVAAATAGSPAPPGPGGARGGRPAP